MWKVIILFALIVVYKALLNFTRLKQLQRYEKEFVSFLSDKPSKIDEHKMQAIELFKKANIPDSQMPVTQPVGFGKVASFNASVYHNFPMAERAIAEPTLLMFKNAIGVYKSRIFEAINPLYWIDLIVFLPKNLLTYIGLNMDNASSKLWNVFLSFVWWTFCTLVTIFQPEIKQYIVEFIRNF